MKELEIAKEAITSKNMKLTELSDRTNIPYKTIQRYRQNPNLLSSAEYSRVVSISQAYQDYELHYHDLPQCKPIVEMIKKRLFDGLLYEPSDRINMIDPIIYVDNKYGENDIDYNWSQNNSSPQYFLRYKNTSTAAVSCYIQNLKGHFFISCNVNTHPVGDFTRSLHLPDQRINADDRNACLDLIFKTNLNQLSFENDNFKFAVLDSLNPTDITVKLINRRMLEELNFALQHKFQRKISKADFAYNILNQEAFNQEYSSLLESIAKQDNEIMDISEAPLINNIRLLIRLSNDREISHKNEFSNQLNKTLNQYHQNHSRKDLIWNLSDLVSKLFWLSDKMQNTGLRLLYRTPESGKCRPIEADEKLNKMYTSALKNIRETINNFNYIDDSFFTTKLNNKEYLIKYTQDKFSVFNKLPNIDVKKQIKDLQKELANDPTFYPSSYAGYFEDVILGMNFFNDENIGGLFGSK